MIKKLCMFLVSLTWLIGKNPVRKISQKRNILIIIERPGIGDAVLCLNALYNFTREVNKENRFCITIAASRFTCNFLRNVGSSLNLNFLELQLELDKRNDVSLFINNHKKLADKHWDYIISFDRIGGYVKGMLLGISYGQLIASEYQIGSIVTKIDKIYNSILSNKLYLNFKYSNNLILHKALVCKALVCILGFERDIQYEVYKIPVLCEFKPHSKNYCVISAGIAKGHDNQPRGWPVDRYREVADYILNNTDMDILLCGSNDDLESNNALYRLINNDRRVHNLTAKTTFAEWVETLRNAKFVFGNDSGYIHLAAALGTQAFVIAGYWNYGRFLPYEKDADDVVAPIDIRVKRPKCALCNITRHDCNEKKLCDESVRKNNIYSCIDAIDSNLAISKISEWLEDNKYV